MANYKIGVRDDPEFQNFDYKKIKIATLFVWGKKDTLVSPINLARKVQKSVRGSKFIELGGGHTILYQRPEYVVNKIIQSLKEMNIYGKN